MSQIDRRQFLEMLGWSAAGLTVLTTSGCSLIPALPTSRDPEPREVVTSWVQVLESGDVRFACPRQEMGQGISIGFAAIVAEELNVSIDRVRVVLPNTAELPAPVSSTVGSESIQTRMEVVARAAASIRELLLDRAALALDVSRDRLNIADGVVRGPGAKAVTIGELARGFEVTEEVPDASMWSFRRRSRRRHVGRPAPIAELNHLVSGVGKFVDDLRLPGLRHGAVIRSPTIGAEPVRADFTPAKTMPGFVTGVFSDGLVGVVAEHRHQLDAIVSAVVVEWDSATAFDAESVRRAIDIDRIIEIDGLQHELADDDIDFESGWDVDMRVDVPFAAHASIEPRCAVAEPLGDERWRIHAATQDAFLVRTKVARALGISESDVEVVSYRVGGGFGGRVLPLCEPEAALLSRAVGGPVKVRWTRAEEFHEGYHRPPSSHRVRARVRGGRVVDWWHAFASGHVFFSHAGGPKWQLGFATIAADGGAARGAVPPYQFGARRVEFRDEPLPIRTGPWRGLGAAPNGLAVELAMSRLSAIADADPVAFRLRHLPAKNRLARAIRRVAEASGWARSQRGALADGSVLGVGAGIYKGKTYVAAVARVANVDGRLRVTDVWCAHDCGLVVNPDQVGAQIEGNIVWAASSVLVEGIAVGHSTLAASTFGDAPILNIEDAPAIHIDLVESDSNAPTGAGESAFVAAIGAVANAWERATGQPIDSLPVRSR